MNFLSFFSLRAKLKRRSTGGGVRGVKKCCTILWRMEPHAPQKCHFLWRMWTHAPQNCAAPNHWCQAHHISVAHGTRCATEMYITFLWRTLLHAPQKRQRRMQASRWLWGPQNFCGAWRKVRHRMSSFSGACPPGAPQKS